MATSRNITYTFANQTSMDLWTDGVFYPWDGDTSGKFMNNPVGVPSGSTIRAFAACGDSDTATGTEGTVKYWLVPAGATTNSQAVGHVSCQFEIWYSHTSSDNNAWSNPASGAFAKGQYTITGTGFSKQADSVSVVLTFATASAAKP